MKCFTGSQMNLLTPKTVENHRLGVGRNTTVDPWRSLKAFFNFFLISGTEVTVRLLITISCLLLTI